ncbi:MAG: TIGR04150 pseudo-rSAM protein [Candidatus Aminicenantes bacterium]|nr:TIGR04150 pseudo-rSAM protein [Candidatus Aminicenantes bacterium]
MEKKYWFYIDNYVHLFLNNDSALFYNTYSGNCLEYEGNAIVMKLVKRILAPRNCRVILLKEAEIDQPAVREFIDKIRAYYMGDLIDSSYSKGKPIEMPPLVKNQLDVTFLKKDSARSVGDEIMSYLTEISLYLNETCAQGCAMCKSAYRQFPCCFSPGRENNLLKPGCIKNLFSEIEHSSLARLNILGGNILLYPDFNGLMPIVNRLAVEKNYYLHYINVLQGKSFLKNIAGKDSRLTIIVNAPIEEEKLEQALTIAYESGVRNQAMFIILGEREFETAELIIEKYGIENYLYIPFYNGCNLDFFKKNLYIAREDFEVEPVAAKEIYERSYVNSLNFGRMVVFPDGRVYANINDPSLGLLGKDSIYSLLCKELERGKSWRKVRKKVFPCKKCNFACLCPPISNYNSAIGRYNLCNMWEA